MKISILHPSRQRVKLAYDTFCRWMKDPGNTEIEYIMSIDNDDDSNYVGQLYSVMQYHGNSRVIKNDNRSAIDAINNAAKVATGDIFIVVSDDFDCPDNWARSIIEASEGKTDWIMKTPDGYQKWMITCPIMDRVYFNRFGYIYFPEYRHLFPDTEMSCVADYLGRRITANIPFRHRHHSLEGGIKRDEVSLRADKTWNQGEKLFFERFKRNFDLNHEDMIGEISDQEMKDWIMERLKKYS